MKHKNLEKAVLLTVMLMSFHGGVEAAAVTNNDINTDTTTAVDSIIANDGNEHNVSGNGDLTVQKNGNNLIYITNNSSIIFNNPNTTVDTSSFGSIVNVDNGKLQFGDSSKLTINNTYTYKGSANVSVEGLNITNDKAVVNIGEAGLKIDLNITDDKTTDGNWNMGAVTGIKHTGGNFTAEGDLDIDITTNSVGIATGILTGDPNNADTNRIFNIKNADIYVDSTQSSATGIQNTFAGSVNMGDVDITVKAAQNAFGIDTYSNSVTNLGNVTVNASTVDNDASTVWAAGIKAYGSEVNANTVNITAESNNYANLGINAQGNSKIEFNGGQITLSNGKRTAGLGVYADAYVESTGYLKIKAKNAKVNYGVQAEGDKVNVKLANTDMELSNGEQNIGIVSAGGAKVTADYLKVTASGGSKSNYGVYSVGSEITIADADITTSGTQAVGVMSTGTTKITESAKINSEKIAYANGQTANIDFEKSLIADNGTASQILASAGGAVNINSTGEGTVIYRGVTRFADDVDNTINMNLNNVQSVWNLTGSSELTDFNSANNSLLDMTQDSGAYSNVTVNGNMTGNGGIIKMDIDETKNANNSDRLYVNGTHSGTHYIDINPGGTNFDGKSAVGTVLVSVGTETGEFKAKDSEGTLFWNSYDLTQQDSTTGGYTKDWVVSEWTQKDEPTTSVDTILGANALNYHTWRAENDQLMRRMGELRNNGTDVEGAWFRVHGSKINRDDSMSFENKYTTYELGYDQITKQTDDMVRYTGAALSYTDGSGTYERGNGENHSKAIAFYNTDIYNSGHYLDLVFKYANMDNDFNVYDTNNNKISGEYKNTGISVSAEYGRKNDLKNGWYVEPQAQLTLGYFGGDEYETSNGISVDQSGIASVLGRIGFNIGKQIGDSGVIYAKANLLHEFAGDYDIDMYDSAGNHRAESASFNDTWFEYGVGAALKTGKNNHLYFDFVKTAGGDFEKDWQWNAGMRWTF